MQRFIDISRCPETGEPMRLAADGSLVTESGVAHPVQDGIASFVTRLEGAQAAAQEFYDSFGWKPDASGLLGDSSAFLDMRATPRNFAHWCMRRIGRRYFANGGEFLLDAGSGPLVDDEVLNFGAAFRHHICADLSARALKGAQAKLGDKGIYLQADITNLPIRDGVIDAVTCNHVIYQLPNEMQAPVFEELYRVLKPGGVAVVISWWYDAKLTWRLERIARLLPMRGPGEPKRSEPLPELPHNIRPRAWFESQPWSFSYEYDTYRTVPEFFMRTYISDDWRGRLFLGGLQVLQTIAPRYCGTHGLMPAIVLRKPL